MMTRAPRAVSPRAISLPIPSVPPVTSAQRPLKSLLACMNSRRHLELLMPATDGVRHKIWGVTHREVIPFRNDDLSRSREQFLPALLKAKRIVALAKYGEQRYRGQWPGEHGRHTCIHIVAVKGVTHIVVERAEAMWTHPSAKRRAARPIQVATDTEGRRSDTRNQTGQDIKLARDRT